MNESSSNPLSSLGLFVLRVGAGAMMLVGHGWPKLANFSAIAEKFPNVLGLGSTVSLTLATTAEVLCAALLIVGLATRLAALPLVMTMGVAAFWAHGGHPWFQGVPPVASKEPALLYLIPFVALLFTGGGRYSVDEVLASRKKGGES